MTRETKIGLLVGLAFIIVIGILLSDHLATTIEPPEAALSGAGSTAREATATLGTPQMPAYVSPPPVVTPDSPVVTAEELHRRAANVRPPGVVLPRAASSSETGIGGLADQPAQPVAPPAQNSSDLVHAAHDAGEEVVAFNQQPGAEDGHSVTIPGGTPAAPATPAGFVSYKAQAGDSISRIAARFLGKNTQANRAMIMAANASLKADPNRVIVGRTYLIPTANAPAGTASLPSAGPAWSSAPPAKATIASDEPTKASPGGWYTVKEDDNLWHIAAAECGSGSAWAAIKELNKDVLHGGDAIRAGMRLRLPAKAVASAE